MEKQTATASAPACNALLHKVKFIGVGISVATLQYGVGMLSSSSRNSRRSCSRLQAWNQGQKCIHNHQRHSCPDPADERIQECLDDGLACVWICAFKHHIK